jgi:hypothetical protein
VVHFKLLITFFFISLIAQGEDCPPNPTAWQAWLNRNVSALVLEDIKISTVPYGTYSYTNQPHLEIISKKIKECRLLQPILFTTDSPVPMCLNNLENYSQEMFKVSHDGLYDFTKDYPANNNVESTKFDPLLKNDEFLISITDLFDFSQARKVIEKINKQVAPFEKWQIAEFDGHSFNEAPHDSPRRLIVMIPGNPQKFILVGIQNPFTAGNIVETSAVFTKPNGKKIFYQGEETHLKYVVDANHKSSVKVDWIKSGTCYQCHANGLNAIYHTNKESLSEGGIAINNYIKQTGPIEVSPNFDINKLGPSYGETSPERNRLRTLEFFSKCSDGAIKNQADADKIKKLMNCMSCHDGETRNIIIPANNHLMRRLVLDGHMPKTNNSLTLPERESLLKCLKYEYNNSFVDAQGKTNPSILEAWLTSSSCTALPIKDDVNGPNVIDNNRNLNKVNNHSGKPQAPSTNTVK